MNNSQNINDTNNVYLTALKDSHFQILELSGQTRSCVSNLLKLSNEIDADKLRGFVDAIEIMDDTAKHLQWLIDRQHKSMSAKPGEFIVLD